MKLFVIAKREYLDRVRKRSFLISTILGPVLMAGMIVVPMLLFRFTPETRLNVSIVDLTGVISPKLSASLSDTLADGSKMFALRDVSANVGNVEAIKERLSVEVRAGTLDGYLVIPAAVVDSGAATYYGEKVSNVKTLERIERALDQTVIGMRLERAGMDYARVRKLIGGVRFETIQVTGKEEKKGGFDRLYFTVFIFIMLLYMTILLWGVAVQRSIIEEKNSRVIELLLSSVRAFDLMAGKIVGVGAVGLTQYAIWAVFGSALSFYALSSGQFNQFASFDVTTLLYFIMYYVLGFLFYATMLAGVGAVCNSDQEAQQLQTPIVMCLAFTIIIPMAIMQNPEGPFAVVISLVPFFSPIVMFMRINILKPPAWQIAASVAILIASIWVTALIVSKIFRVGILMYGKRPDLHEMVRWLRRA